MTKPWKWQKTYDLGFVGWFFLVAVRSHKQIMHGCNLESSLLSNFFIIKDFIVHMFRKWTKNLPFTKISTIDVLSIYFFILTPPRLYIQDAWYTLSSFPVIDSILPPDLPIIVRCSWQVPWEQVQCGAPGIKYISQQSAAIRYNTSGYLPSLIVPAVFVFDSTKN